MNNKHVSFILILLVMFWIRFKPVIAGPELIIVPDDYPTIQQAINAADEGASVFIRSGIYLEHIVVNRSITLVGESRDATILDGGGNGTVVRIERSNVRVSGFTIRNAGCVSGFRYSGVSLIAVANCTVESVSVRNCAVGILPFNSSFIRICSSSISNNHFGIVISISKGVIMRANNLTCNNVDVSGYKGANFRVYGERLSHFIHDIDSSNKVDGKTICYWVNRHNEKVPSDVGYVAIVNSTNVTIEDLTLRGLLFAYVNKSTVRNINVSHVFMGVEMIYSSNNRIVNSTISSNSYGFYLVGSHGNCMINNTISANNKTGLDLCGPNGSNNNLIVSNVISHNPSCAVYIHGTDNSVMWNDISYNEYGVTLSGAYGNKVVGNTISNNSEFGIYLTRSSKNNLIRENIIKFNDYGVFIIDSSRDNMIYHNNFIGNKVQAFAWKYAFNIWDDGLEGNYWSDYKGGDDNQDGVGDAPYIIYENSRDNCPLRGMFHCFNITSEHDVTIISNSSVFGFHFNRSSGTIKFNVITCGAIGFCRVRFHKALLGDGPYIVTVNGSSPLLLKELAISNSAHKYIYFTYPSETREVLIIPEFPSFTILLFVMACLSIATILGKLK